jgi:hypothetical protein
VQKSCVTLCKVCVGHSLGAGTAAILCILLRREYPTATCFSYSPPGGLLRYVANEKRVPNHHVFLLLALRWSTQVGSQWEESTPPPRVSYSPPGGLLRYVANEKRVSHQHEFLLLATRWSTQVASQWKESTQTPRVSLTCPQVVYSGR